MSSNQPFAIETQTIGMVLWNPTNEKLDMQYAGISLSMEPGADQVFEINCAKHLLNSFGPRGLTSLMFGCDEKRKKEIGEAAKKRNHDFKETMVRKYNQQNAVRTQLGMGYLPATLEVVKYAFELGIKLDDKFTTKDPERQAATQAEAKNAELEKRVGELTAMVEKLLAAKEPAKPPQDYDCTKCKRVFGSQEALDDHMKAHKG
jgi:hypothetical protein